jgi:hypothetical protein
MSSEHHLHSHAGHHHHAHVANHRPHDEPVVLEIGDELGALIVYTESALLHAEIEISPAGEDERRSHKDVLERIVAGRSLYAAVFDRLAQGTYTLWHDGIARTRGAEVDGGAIAEVSWRA